MKLPTIRFQLFPKFRSLTSLLLVLMLILTQSLAAWGAEVVDRFEKTITKQVGSHYLVVKPEGYDESKSYPLLIFLHGMGEQGDDTKLLTVHGPYKMVKKLGLDLIIVAPQSPLDEWWDIDMLSAFVDEVVQKYPVNKNRIYLTGLSMGGEAVWRLAVRRPHTFAALVPVCGFGIPSQAAKISHLPTWAFHGAKDTTVLLKRTTTMIKALKTAGGQPRMTIYDDVGHASWKPAYNDPELYEWLMAQSLEKTPAK